MLSKAIVAGSGDFGYAGISEPAAHQLIARERFGMTRAAFPFGTDLRHS
jgi:hypothetical protein